MMIVSYRKWLRLYPEFCNTLIQLGVSLFKEVKPFARCWLLVSFCSLLFRFCSLLVTFCSLLVTFCSLFVSFCSLLVPLCSLLVRFCSLLVRFCSLLVSFCVLLVTFCSLLDKKFWKIFLSKSEQKLIHVNLYKKFNLWLTRKLG